MTQPAPCEMCGGKPCVWPERYEAARHVDTGYMSEFEEYERAEWDSDRLAAECARLRIVAAALAEALREWVEYGGDETKSRAALRQFDGTDRAD